MLPQKYPSIVIKHKKIIVNYPFISQNNGYHVDQQNPNFNRNVHFTLSHIKFHAPTEVIIEF